ncbi:ABC transporter permease [Neobacillus sp. YIM B06451]|uniref:ABC transporter permease n=1 Tax=Neobacillus sp. YIM B06451 TaxID=3070994 RepID=UPI00292EE2C5|nr:ABC transporter permease [Neobacillus sp. YIM B06451]
MIKLIGLEWKKLKRLSVISEVIIYWLILMFMPLLLIKIAMPVLGQSYAAAIEHLNLNIQMGLVLFGGSLISQVFIDEYKNKTISLAFGYPISRKKLFMAKVLFISLFVFLAAMISFILTGLTTYLLDQIFPFINGQPTNSDMITFFSSMISGSLLITLISFIPLFFFGILKRGTISTVICSILVMNLPKLSYFSHFEQEYILAVMCILGGLSIYLSITSAESVGEI